MGIGERIKLARKQKGITQEELGEMLGISGNAVIHYEKGRRTPNASVINQISKALGVTGDWLLETEYAYEKETEQLVRIFKSLSEEGKRMLLVQAEFLIAREESEAKKQKESAG